MPWNPEYYMKKDEVVKILEDNKITNVVKKENPIAKEVRTPKYKQRIVKDKTIYDRKKKKFNEIFQVGEPAPDFTGSYKPPTEEEEDDKMKFQDHLCEIDAVEKLKYKK
jgi:hypothetical protein